MKHLIRRTTITIQDFEVDHITPEKALKHHLATDAGLPVSATTTDHYAVVDIAEPRPTSEPANDTGLDGAVGKAFFRAKAEHARARLLGQRWDAMREEAAATINKAVEAGIKAAPAGIKEAAIMRAYGGTLTRGATQQEGVTSQAVDTDTAWSLIGLTQLVSHTATKANEAEDKVKQCTKESEKAALVEAWDKANKQAATAMRALTEHLQAHGLTTDQPAAHET